VVQVDETPLNVLKEAKQCYTRLYYSGADSPESTLKGVKNVVFDYQNGRSRACPESFLGDYDGYLQTDGYKAYDGLIKLKYLVCLAHARRKFMGAKKLQGKGKNRQSRYRSSENLKAVCVRSLLERLYCRGAIRRTSKTGEAMFDDLHKWLNSQKVVGSSQLSKAIKYTVEWPKVVRYVDDGHLSIDNNRPERAIKSIVIGRKNWLFVADTPKGTDASAMLYSIIETAKVNDLIIDDCLVRYMKELAKLEPDIESLPPWNFSH